MGLSEAGRKGESQIIQVEGSIAFVWGEDSLGYIHGDACAQVLGTGKECGPKAIQLCLPHRWLGQQTRWFSSHSFECLLQQIL